MRTRTLGSTSVTAIGCGDVSPATAAARGVDARELERALHEALAAGVTLVESSPDADGERLCGAAVRELRLRDRVVVATHVPSLARRPDGTAAPPPDGGLAGGRRSDAQGERPPQKALPRRGDEAVALPPAYVQHQVETSLRATRLDALSLVALPVQLAWRGTQAWAELAGVCARLVREGKVLQWAIAADELDGLEQLAAEPWLVAMHVAFNACERAAEPLAAAAAPVVLARRPLAGGALAGQLGPGVPLALRDDRSALGDAQLEKIAVAIATLAPLVEREPAAARSCDAARAALERGRRPPHVEALTVAELALRYVIDRGAIALPRLHRREHVAEAIAAASARPLSSELCDRIASALGGLYT